MTDPIQPAAVAIAAIMLALVVLFVRLSDRYASAETFTSTRRSRPRRVKVPYLLEPFRDTHSQTQEMRYLLEPYRGAAPAWEVIER